MTTLVSKASKHLRESKVTGFSTTGMSALIYLGSFLWFAGMMGVDAVSLVIQEDDIVIAGITAVMILNVLMFALQTVNILYYVFKFWPITSLYWTCQLTAIGILSGSVGYTLSKEDGDRVMLFSTTLGRLFAQCLFTSSQFAVTLEYLYRSSAQCPSKNNNARLQLFPAPRPSGMPRRYSR